MKMTPPCHFCKDKLHATAQCKDLIEALRKNPNPKPPSQKGQCKGGFGGGKRYRGKRGGGGGGQQQGQQEERAPKRGRTDPQQN